MSDAIDELLIRWQELRRRGESPSVRELCGDHPSLADELRQRINAFESMELMLGIGPQGTLPATSTPQGVPPHLAEKLLPLGYDLIELIDQGGMGVVYKATQIELRRTVALKMIAGIRVGPKQLARFRSEAEAIARLQHPHIVQIYEVGEVDGHSFFAMEYVAGGTLAHKLEAGPLPPAGAAALVEVLARAVHHAHTRGIVHRDLKPANILLQGVRGEGSGDREERTSSFLTPDLSLQTPELTPDSFLPTTLIPKLTDFGLAKRLGADVAHTTTGEVIGTPAYMSPEQARGDTHAIGTRADVYALGAILYESLTGRAPFRGGSLLETLRQVLSDEPVPPRHVKSGIPRDLEAICLKCLEKNPVRRYASAEALADDLHRYAIGLPVEARRGIPARAIKWARRHPLLLAALSLVMGAAVAAPAAIAGREYLDRKREEAERERIRKRAIEVAPQAREILNKHCYECHGDKKAERGFHVFNRASLLNADRKNVVPGDPDSLLIRRIVDGSMPPEKDEDGWRPRVHETEVAILKEWILGGAPEFPPEDPSNPTMPVVPRSELAAKVFEIFDRSCTGCHSVADPNGGIRILNHNLLLQRRVLVPGKDGEDPELYRLVGPAVQKLKMPKGGKPLPPDEVNKIKQWLDAGAPPFPPRPKKK